MMRHRMQGSLVTKNPSDICQTASIWNIDRVLHITPFSSPFTELILIRCRIPDGWSREWFLASWTISSINGRHWTVSIQFTKQFSFLLWKKTNFLVTNVHFLHELYSVAILFITFYLLVVEFLPHNVLSFKPSRLCSLILIEIYYKKKHLCRSCPHPLWVIIYWTVCSCVKFSVRRITMVPVSYTMLYICVCPSPVSRRPSLRSPRSAIPSLSGSCLFVVYLFHSHFSKQYTLLNCLHIFTTIYIDQV